jgi:hypothetical protein
MGVSFHRVFRRFEGRESAASDLCVLCAALAEPRLNVSVRKPLASELTFAGASAERWSELQVRKAL